MRLDSGTVPRGSDWLERVNTVLSAFLRQNITTNESPSYLFSAFAAT